MDRRLELDAAVKLYFGTDLNVIEWLFIVQCSFF
jgi:hypothetical protein